MTSPATAWNALHMPGTSVAVQRIPFLPFRHAARTAGRAFDFYGKPMVHLVGYRRPVPLSRVEPTTER